MHALRPFLPSMAAVSLLAAGCGKSVPAISEPEAAGAAEFIVTESSRPAGHAANTPDSQTEVLRFLKTDSFCRDVHDRMALTDFLAEHLSAAKDTAQSRSDIGYLVYQESLFLYEFLDERLFAIRYVLPKTNGSAANAIAEYEAALGAPTDTEIPADFRPFGTTKFFSWDLLEHNVRINFAHVPSRFADVEVELFGQFINRQAMQEFLTRSSTPVRASSKERAARSTKTLSTTSRAIEAEIADPVWGRVAAKINHLCAGQLSEEEIHVQILKTIRLARDGGFSPEFTLQALQQGEATATRLRLSPVTAVNACQQSLALGTATTK